MVEEPERHLRAASVVGAEEQHGGLGVGDAAAVGAYIGAAYYDQFAGRATIPGPHRASGTIAPGSAPGFIAAQIGGALLGLGGDVAGGVGTLLTRIGSRGAMVPCVASKIVSNQA